MSDNGEIKTLRGHRPRTFSILWLWETQYPSRVYYFFLHLLWEVGDFFLSTSARTHPRYSLKGQICPKFVISSSLCKHIKILKWLPSPLRRWTILILLSATQQHPYLLPPPPVALKRVRFGELQGNSNRPSLYTVRRRNRLIMLAVIAATNLYVHAYGQSPVSRTWLE